MAALSKDKQEFYKSRIRALLSMDHHMTHVVIIEPLAQEGIQIDRKYLSKLIGKVCQERIKRADRQTLNYALAAFEDTMTEVVRVAWKIANEPFAAKADRVAALREIRAAHNDVFDKLFDAGVFERKLGTLDTTIRNTPLPEERKQNIREVFGNWKLIPPPVNGEPPTPSP